MNIVEITELIRQRIKQDGMVNVIIAGATCSGKSTLSDKLVTTFNNEVTVTVIRQDDYFKDLSEIPKIAKGFLTDSINAFHSQEFKHDAEILLTTGKTFIPRYDVSQNLRVAKDVQITSGIINIFEGLHTISLLRNIEKSILIFIDTPLDICLERRVVRDTELYNIPENRIRENFMECILPMYRSYVAPQLKMADAVIEGSG